MHRSTARPLQNPSRQRPAACRRPATNAIATARNTSGSHQGRPSGPTSVNEVSATSAASMVRIGTSAAISAGTRGQSSRAVLRNVAIRAAAPSWLWSWLPT